MSMLKNLSGLIDYDLCLYYASNLINKIPKCFLDLDVIKNDLDK